LECAVSIAEEEAQGAWQRGISYKGFGPSVRSVEGIDVERVASLQEQPVQSAFTVPKRGAQLTPGANTVQVDSTAQHSAAQSRQQINASLC
jgi:hypothetical protein